ncbi:MAG: TonB-dependent receptor plug domain-containing protein [Calditrichia bacterium]
MIKIIFITFIILSSVLFLQAQYIRINGQVVDFQSEEPLQGADVYLSSGGCGAVTDTDGTFQLFCKKVAPDDSLIVSYLGFQTYHIRFRQYKNGSTIYLKSKSLELGDEIVVSAERIDILKQDIPLAKSTVDYQEIQQYGSSEISDILKPLPAIRIEGNDLDGRRIQIRGSDPDEVNVYLDGILINNVRSDNAADLSIIPVESIESLEILKGGNSALLGQGAFGGVVSIKTRQETEPSFYVKGKMGSFDCRYLISNVSYPLQKRLILSYFGQASTLSPTIEYFPGERFSEKTRSEGITTSKQNHMVNLSYYGRQSQISSYFIEYLYDYKKPSWESTYRNYLFATSFKGELLGVRDLEISVNHLFARDKIVRKQTGTSEFINSYITNQTNLRLAKRIIFPTVDFQFLTEYYHDDLLNDSKVKDFGFENGLYHGFIYDNRGSVAGVISFRDKLKNLPILSWKTYLGLRGDFVASGNQDGTVTTGAQVNYNLEQLKLSPYFNYGKNVKYPSLREPEYNNSAELGISLTYFPKATIYRTLDFSLALFTNTVYNKLLTRPFDDLIASVQVGRNQTRGIETSFKFNQLLKWFSLGAAFVKIDVTNPLLYSYKPKENLSINLGFYAPMGLYLTSTFFYEGTSVAWYYDRDYNILTEEISPYNDMDVSCGFKVPFKDAEFDFQVSGYNIFDHSGFKYYYLKKRYVQFSVAMRY